MLLLENEAKESNYFQSASPTHPPALALPWPFVRAVLALD